MRRLCGPATDRGYDKASWGTAGALIWKGISTVPYIVRVRSGEKDALMYYIVCGSISNFSQGMD